MLVVMHSHATPQQIGQAVEAIRRMNLTPHPMPGATRTAIGITGNMSAVDPRTLEVLPGVFELIRVTKPYKLASRELHGGERGDDPADGGVPHGARRPPDARRGVQAADQPLCLPGDGPQGAGNPR